MKICPNPLCNQLVGEDISICPTCGSEIGGGRMHK
jgi:RNA polymerase subunit RPABC4/transcription elongation factor Spt4